MTTQTARKGEEGHIREDRERVGATPKQRRGFMGPPSGWARKSPDIIARKHFAAIDAWTAKLKAGYLKIVRG